MVEKPQHTSMSAIVVTTSKPLNTTAASLLTTTSHIPKVCHMNGEVVFIVDSTTPVGGKNFQLQLQTTRYIIDRLEHNKNKLLIAIASYGLVGVINLSFERYKVTSDLNSIIANMKYQGGATGSGSVLSLVNQNLFLNKSNSTINRIVVFFTSAVQNTGPDPVIVTRVMKLEKGIKFLVIGVGPDSNNWVNSQIASNIKANIFVQNFKSLPKVHDQIIHIICTL